MWIVVGKVTIKINTNKKCKKPFFVSSLKKNVCYIFIEVQINRTASTVLHSLTTITGIAKMGQGANEDFPALTWMA